MDLLIVGAGAMGRWVAETVGPGASVTFADVDEVVARSVADELDAGVVPIDTDQRFDVVGFAVPMSVIDESIAAHASRAREAVFDVSGSMVGPVEAMAEHASRLERASLHPLFAPENAPGNVAVVEAAPGPVINAVLDHISEAGNTLVETTAAEHDELMTTVQAKAHAAILAFAVASEDVPEGFSTPVYEGLVDLVEQVTDGSPHVYAEIQDAFGGAHEVAEAARQIAEADEIAFERLYREAADRR